MKTFKETAEANHVSVKSLNNIQAKDGIPGTEWVRIEKSANEFADQFRQQWHPFSESPDNKKEKVLVQESDGSIGLWVYSVAAKFSGLEKLMWQRLPERYVPPMNYITQPFKPTPPSHE